MRNLNWLHISDIHFSETKLWRDSESLNSLVCFLENEYQDKNLPRPELIFCTGDIAFGETRKDSLASQYKKAEEFFDTLLMICGQEGIPLPKDRLFVVPGNHDVNRLMINKDAQATITAWGSNADMHVSEMNQRFEDKTAEFRATINRLDDYSQFIKNYLPHQFDEDGRHHYAKIINLDGLNIGVAGFNSAWTCAGSEDDRNIWLAARWQFNKSNQIIGSTDIRIGLIHHPVDWLNSSDRATCNTKISEQYDFWLHGHSHSAWVTPVQSHTVIAAGALGAEETEEFGANIVSIDLLQKKSVVHLLTRKSDSDWTAAIVAHHAPLGKWKIDFSEKLRGRLEKKIFVPIDLKDRPMETPTDVIITRAHLERKLKNSLLFFSEQIVSWVHPIISAFPESFQDPIPPDEITTDQIIANPESIVIKAPPQYGLSSLANYLAYEAWNGNQRAYWILLDAGEIKPNKHSIQQKIDTELQDAHRSQSDIACIMLDSWSISEKEGIKLFNKICELYPNLRIICFQQVSAETIGNEVAGLNKDLKTLYLWSLNREGIRKIVSGYNDKKQIGDETQVTSRLISDMDVLNLHRTPLNCLTLLKVSELDFDENPVNRSEVIKRVLFLLFNIDDIPTYKTRPDLKDCEHILGYYCELLIKKGTYGFTRSDFTQTTQDYSKAQLIEIETQVVFDVLFSNNIIVNRGGLFYFRFSYWLFYFAAQRMHHDSCFASFMLEDMRYSQHVEIIEFYTGIDRRRPDAVTTLINDIRKLREEVKNNCGLPEELNPYRLGKWKTSDESKLQMQEEVANGVAHSTLPEAIKDQYADRFYDRSRPYNQALGNVLSEHSFVKMMQVTVAGSRALRNSDYVSVDLKRELLSEILLCWEQTSKIIFITIPILAEHSSANYDGVNIIIKGDLSSHTLQERYIKILTSIPASIANKFAEDLFSMKIGPLLIDKLEGNAIPELSKHELILLLINKRPKNWQREVLNYIISVQHNSFYLFDTYNSLRLQYEYAFASPQTLREIENLIRTAAAKHASGSKKPNAKLIEKVNSNVIPERFERKFE